MATPAEAPSPETRVGTLLAEIQTKVDWLAISEQELEELGAFQYPGAREDWQTLESLRAEEDKQRRSEFTRTRFQNIIRKRLIYEWLQKNTTVKEDSGRQQILNTIQICLRDDRESELVEYLCDVVALDLDRANKKRKRERLGRAYPALIIWAAFSAVLRLTLVFFILQAADGKFQTIVFAILVLIYNRIAGASQDESYRNAMTTRRTHELLKRVMLKLKYDELDWEHSQRIEEERETDKALLRTTVPSIIVDCSLGLTWLFAIYKLVVALLP